MSEALEQRPVPCRFIAQGTGAPRTVAGFIANTHTRFGGIEVVLNVLATEDVLVNSVTNFARETEER